MEFILETIIAPLELISDTRYVDQQFDFDKSRWLYLDYRQTQSIVHSNILFHVQS